MKGTGIDKKTAQKHNQKEKQLHERRAKSYFRAEMAASLSHLCRLCGADTKNIKRNAIFDGEGCVKKYANKITECLTLQVKEEDQLPKVMCGECSQKLDLLSDFRDTAYKTESAFLTMVADLEKIKDEPEFDDNPSIDFSPSSPEMDLEQLVIKEDEPPPPPPVLIEKRPVRQAALKHLLHPSKEQVPAKKSKPPKKTVLKSTPPLKEIPKPTVQVFDCKLCHSPFSSDAEVQTHMDTTHSAAAASNMKTEESDDEGQYAQLGASDTKQEEHLPPPPYKKGDFLKSVLEMLTKQSQDMSNKEQAASSLALKIRLERNLLGMHHEFAHSAECVKVRAQAALDEQVGWDVQTASQVGVTPIRCDWPRCGRVFATPHFHLLHLAEEHEPFGCDACSRRFATKEALERHLTAHAQHRPGVLKCGEPRCAFTTERRKALLDHWCCEHSFSPIVCRLCNKASKDDEDCRLHMRQCHPQLDLFDCQCFQNR